MDGFVFKRSGKSQGIFNFLMRDNPAVFDSEQPLFTS